MSFATDREVLACERRSKSATLPRMALTISSFDRWTAREKNGIWAMLEGPPEVATA